MFLQWWQLFLATHWQHCHPNLWKMSEVLEQGFPSRPHSWPECKAEFATGKTTNKDNLQLICVLLRGYVRRCASSWSTGNELFLSCEAFPLFNAAAFHVFDVIPGNPPELPTSQPSSSGHVQQSRVHVLLAQHVTPPLPLQYSSFCSSIKHQRASSHL